MRLAGTVAALALLAAGCGTARPSLAARAPIHGGLADAPVEVPRPATVQGQVKEVIAAAGPIYLSGQPSEAALRELVAGGVTVVVNLRTPEEMADRAQVPFDEEALVKSLGASYVHVPLGGKDHPYTPAAVDEVARALAAHQGKALLHCTVAWRASHMWAAYLVRHRGVPVATALEHARAVNAGTRWPMADLLDADVALEPRGR
ncbi:MAG: sulfur transferase domain-containing protein [Anaeromyxobacteraceae bacterium]